MNTNWEAANWVDGPHYIHDSGAGIPEFGVQNTGLDGPMGFTTGTGGQPNAIRHDRGEREGWQDERGGGMPPLA